MKRWTGFTLLLAIIVISTSFGTYSLPIHTRYSVPEGLAIKTNMKPPVFHDSLSMPNTTFTNPPFLGMAYHGFKEALAFKESGGRYTVVNRFGYLGKYQFGLGTLRVVGVYNAYDFLYNPALQEKAFEANVARNKWILRKYITYFKGKRIKGVKITESGILAAAHLAGAGNVKKYLLSHGLYDVADAYGSSISYYIKKFAGYDISNIKQKRNARV